MPPVAKIVPHSMTVHGDTRVDNYFWLRDRTDPDTIAYLETLKPAQFEGAEDKTITWQTRHSTRNMQGTPYLFHHVLPNVFFHVTTTYDILRQAGVELGKLDFLGRG